MESKKYSIKRSLGKGLKELIYAVTCLVLSRLSIEDPAISSLIAGSAFASVKTFRNYLKVKKGFSLWGLI